MPTTVMHLRRGGTSLLLDIDAASLPSVLYWGEDLGDLSDEDCRSIARGLRPSIVSGGADVPARLSLVPLQADGWVGVPGIDGSRPGGDGAFAALRTVDVQPLGGDVDPGSVGVAVSAEDDGAGLSLSIDLELTASGLLRMRAALTNTGADDYEVRSLLLALPLPSNEDRVVDQTGRHLRERDTVTHEFTIGTHERTTRVGRAHAGSTIHGTCRRGTDWRSGSTHYAHVGWSGNTRTVVERNPLGQRALICGELLMGGEVILGTGDTYRTPWVYATWGAGFDEAATRFHDFLRARPTHPTSVRPVTLNAWEAVYFDHSIDRLLALVDAAARVGVERFVLDDGWFSSRRDDTSGLGDWTVSDEVWPRGLAPLADAVHGHGMQFGLWFEPEMVNIDSDLARAHPEWILAPKGRMPRVVRHQQVLDLANPDAYRHVLTQMLAVLDSVRVDYIKWDFNRDLYEVLSPLTGAPSYHAQTLATYALMRDITDAHPEIEIESCAGGGGRIDLGIMEHAVRVWGSDCIDPIERIQIEEGTSLLLPPELVGSHIASTTSHTTGRMLQLSLRAGVALFSHMGIEWDLTAVSEQEIVDLGAWVRLHKDLRGLVHSGRVVHGDHEDPQLHVRGAVGDDDAVYAVTRLATSQVRPAQALRLPELPGDAPRYRFEILTPEGVPAELFFTRFDDGAWWAPESWEGEHDSREFTGADLSSIVLPRAGATKIGVQLPELFPQQTLLLRVTPVHHS